VSLAVWNWAQMLQRSCNSELVKWVTQRKELQGLQGRGTEAWVPSAPWSRRETTMLQSACALTRSQVWHRCIAALCITCASLLQAAKRFTLYNSNSWVVTVFACSSEKSPSHMHGMLA
jgi:hypothetical protein